MLVYQRVDLQWMILPPISPYFTYPVAGGPQKNIPSRCEQIPIFHRMEAHEIFLDLKMDCFTWLIYRMLKKKFRIYIYRYIQNGQRLSCAALSIHLVSPLRCRAVSGVSDQRGFRDCSHCSTMTYHEHLRTTMKTISWGHFTSLT
jgi:hypothetical protein